MSAPKRVLLAFCCLLLSFPVFSLVGTVPAMVRYGAAHARPQLETFPVYAPATGADA